MCCVITSKSVSKSASMVWQLHRTQQVIFQGEHLLQFYHQNHLDEVNFMDSTFSRLKEMPVMQLQLHEPHNTRFGNCLMLVSTRVATAVSGDFLVQ